MTCPPAPAAPLVCHYAHSHDIHPLVALSNLHLYSSVYQLASTSRRAEKRLQRTKIHPASQLPPTHITRMQKASGCGLGEEHQHLAARSSTLHPNQGASLWHKEKTAEKHAWLLLSICGRGGMPSILFFFLIYIFLIILLRGNAEDCCSPCPLGLCCCHPAVLPLQ